MPVQEVSTVAPSFRPPAVPLITHDPYFSAWSVSDTLTETEVRHWTGTNYGLCGLICIDGVVYRMIGTQPPDVAPMAQIGLQALPTRSIYDFEEAGYLPYAHVPLASAAR